LAVTAARNGTTIRPRWIGLTTPTMRPASRFSAQPTPASRPPEHRNCRRQHHYNHSNWVVAWQDLLFPRQGDQHYREFRLEQCQVSNHAVSCTVGVGHKPMPTVAYYLIVLVRTGVNFRENHEINSKNHHRLRPCLVVMQSAIAANTTAASAPVATQEARIQQSQA